MSQAAVIRIKPYHYIHVLDQNTNVTRVVVGPASFQRQDHELVVSGPDAMIMIPPRHFCIIQNPAVRTETGDVVTDEFGQVKLLYGDEEIRFDDQSMFPLYPGEVLYGKVSALQVVAPNQALRLRAIRDFEDKENKIVRRAGDEWLFRGPGTYRPRVEAQVVEIVRDVIIGPNQALRLRARRDFTGEDGIKRVAGQEWLVKEEGPYLPSVDEEIRETVSAYILSDKKALQLEAVTSFTDSLGRKRKSGDQWLVTVNDTEAHIPDVNERVVGEVPVTILNSRQYAVVLDPVGADGRPQLGKRELRKGEVSFFLQPGERLESGIQNVYVLDGDEALLLRAREAFVDGKEERSAGDRWMIYGPCDYVPPVTVEVVEKRRSIPLDETEGIYVRNVKDGKVRAVSNQVYMLSPYEELWAKEVPEQVEELLAKEVALQKEAYRTGQTGSRAPARDKTRVVTYRTPHNSAVQIFDYAAKEARVVFGPALVMLDPDEQFTVLSLSGDIPKQPNVIKSLSLLLGPDFMTDVVVVETSDHARLSLKLSYNWHFDIDRNDKEQASKLFSIPDFVGDAAKALASAVRGAVAQQTFDEFHKNSARIIREAVFGVEADGTVRNKLLFSSNLLAITAIDIQSVEPVDSKTRDALQKSVQLAIEITTKSQEASASHEANRREQQAKGRLERQKILDEANSERQRIELLQLQAQSAAVESTGQATAEAKARAEAAAIEGAAAVKQAELAAEAERIRGEARLLRESSSVDAELAHLKAINELEIKKARDLASVEASKFKAIVESIGAPTLEAMAAARSDVEARLLESLQLSTTMITDGSAPINLFQTAQSLIAKSH